MRVVLRLTSWFGLCSWLLSGVGCDSQPLSVGAPESGSKEQNCTGCHASAQSSEDEQAQLSGQHQEHLEKGYRCAACHQDVVGTDGKILAPTLHQNGVANVKLIAGTYDSDTKSCAQTCHGTKSWE